MAVTLAPNMKKLLNSTGSAVENNYEGGDFNPLATWSVAEFKEIGGKLNAFISPKQQKTLCIITRPDGKEVWCGISKAVKRDFETLGGLSNSKHFVSVMPATDDYPQGFLLHVAEGSGIQATSIPEVD